MRNLTDEETELYNRRIEAEAKTVNLCKLYNDTINNFDKIEEFCNEEDKRCLDIYKQIDKFVGSLRLTQDEYNGIMTAIAKEMGIIDYLG